MGGLLEAYPIPVKCSHIYDLSHTWRCESWTWNYTLSSTYTMAVIRVPCALAPFTDIYFDIPFRCKIGGSCVSKAGICEGRTNVN